MKIATYNVNGIRTRLPRVLDWLDEEEPDVVCLQETKVVDEDFPAFEIETRGYSVEIFGQPAYNGVALLSKRPIEDVSRGLPGVDDGESRVIAGTIDGMRIASIYVPNGRETGSKHYEAKLKWLGHLRRYLDTAFDPQKPAVLAGDFNIAPADEDVYDPDRWRGRNLCSEPERDALRELLAWGLSDAFRLYTKEPNQYSWWDYRQGMFWKDQGLRIDHLLITAPVAERLDEVAIRRDQRKGEKPSDHTPVVLILD